MKGVLLINLGSPDSTETKDVKRYLGEFLMDERVIDIAYWKRFLLIKGIILQVRQKNQEQHIKKFGGKKDPHWWLFLNVFQRKLAQSQQFPLY